MAIVIQQHIKCKTGGVVMRQSLTDDTLVTEYVLGQPKGAADELFGATSHCYESKQSQRKVPHHFTEGKINSYFFKPDPRVEPEDLHKTKVTNVFRAFLAGENCKFLTIISQ